LAVANQRIMLVEPSEPISPAVNSVGVDDTLGFRLRVAQLAFGKEFTAVFGEVDITPLLLSVLVLIENNPDCRQNELSAALRVRQTNLVDWLDLLTARGVVSRHVDPVDRRANTVKLTRAGKRLMAQLHTRAEKLRQQQIKRLGEKGYAQLIELLGNLID
jgi:DNA-binding MarR family transcriptional regulator